MCALCGPVRSAVAHRLRPLRAGDGGAAGRDRRLPLHHPEEGAAILEEQLGTVDAATGNVMSYGYEGTVTIDGVDYYNYRVSWLVDGDHMSYLTNYLVSTDGLVVQEYLPEAG